MIAIIPARGGSKGLPGKNIRPLLGKPLIEYTVESAMKAKSISRIIVSTDSPEIADVARQSGAEVPFLRPNYLATDTALAIDTYLFTIDKLRNSDQLNIEEFIVLQPTSPLRTSEDIDNAVTLFREKEADSVISVVEAEHPVQWYKQINQKGVLHDYLTDSSLSNRQELVKTYLPNGAIYILKYELLLTLRTYYSKKTYPYIMPKKRSIDIDELFDFHMAEYLFLEGKSKI